MQNYCKSCNKIITNKKKYCDNKCQHSFQSLKRIQNRTACERTWKTFLLKERGRVCEICLGKTWNNKPIPIELDHIDGNATNNCSENLRLICPNCHAQTETYKSKNKGSGRSFRMQRYNLGKTY